MLPPSGNRSQTNNVYGFILGKIVSCKGKGEYLRSNFIMWALAKTKKYNNSNTFDNWNAQAFKLAMFVFKKIFKQNWD